MAVDTNLGMSFPENIDGLRLISMADNTESQHFIGEESDRFMRWEYIHTFLLADHDMSEDEFCEKIGITRERLAQILEQIV